MDVDDYGVREPLIESFEEGGKIKFFSLPILQPLGTNEGVVCRRGRKSKQTKWKQQSPQFPMSLQNSRLRRVGGKSAVGEEGGKLRFNW